VPTKYSRQRNPRNWMSFANHPPRYIGRETEMNPRTRIGRRRRGGGGVRRRGRKQ